MTNHTVTIAVELVSVCSLTLSASHWITVQLQENARRIVGQCNISHPADDGSSFSITLEPTSPIDGIEESASVRRQNIAFSKDADDEIPLESRINSKIR